METLAFGMIGMIVTLSLILLVNFIVKNYFQWTGANRRANELLCAVLSQEQHRQLMRWGYVDIISPRDPQCIYRVPQVAGLVEVIERGKQTASLCLEPLECIPEADIVVMHKLMIEADEETYVQTAHRFAPVCIEDW